MKTFLMLTTALLACPLLAHAEDWSLKGDWAESCCCQAACPCVFGSAPTKGHCEGSALFEIEEGHLGDIEVDGLSAVITYRIGEWLRVYVDQNASDEQAEAVATLMSQETTFGGLFADADLRSVEVADVTVEKSGDTIKFSVPEASVELEAMRGPNGEIVRVENLAIPWFANGYSQYIAKTTTYERGDDAFSYEGTNGATSRVEASGTID
jgi:hypothetical protein